MTIGHLHSGAAFVFWVKNFANHERLVGHEK